MIKKELAKLKATSIRTYNNLFGRSDYERFAVVTRSRTRSNLLISLLDSHQDIRAFGEEFSRLDGQSCKEVYDKLFTEKSLTAVGFKIFYYHPLDTEDTSIWEIMKNDRSFKIIHLRRENLLRVHISRMIARKTRQWISRGEETIDLDTKKVNVDIDKFLADVNTTNTHIRETRATFRDHPIVEVSYEELVRERGKTLNRILTFLGVENVTLSSELKRQNQEKIEDLVLNYEEVRSRLAGTKYAFMLEE